MRGLTFWPEWLWAIVHLGKPVENRPVPPYKTFRGQRIALHAGKKVAGIYNPTSRNAWQGFGDLIDMASSVGIDSFYLNDVNRRITGIAWTAKKDIKGLRCETIVHSPEGIRLKDLMFDELPVGAIVGTVEILPQWSYFNPHLESPGPWSALGQYQWKMRDLRVLPQPIPMKGKQGPFIVPADIEAQIVASIGG